MRDLKVVVIGGGTGTYTALTGLKHFTEDITAVVTMADDGGSSGRLRDEFGHLPPGDVRRCLVALSADEELAQVVRRLFEYRFDKGYGLNGHSFGNLFLTALTELTGSTEQAILEASKLLNVRGRVLPVTTTDVRLCADLEDDTVIWGEKNIDVRTVNPDVRIRRVFLSPRAQVYPMTAQAIREADLVVIGPGDLYTSVVPNLLVDGVPEAIRACRGARLYVCNLMTKHGETDGFTAADFVAEVTRYLGGLGALDGMVVGTPALSPEVLESYAKEKAYPVSVDIPRCFQYVPRVFTDDLLAHGNLARHDPHKLASLVISMGDVVLAAKGEPAPEAKTAMSA